MVHIQLHLTIHGSLGSCVCVHAAILNILFPMGEFHQERQFRILYVKESYHIVGKQDGIFKMVNVRDFSVFIYSITFIKKRSSFMIFNMNAVRLKELCCVVYRYSR